MSFSNGPTIVTNGLVLALDAGDRNSYVSGSTTWIDLAGTNNGTLTNGPTFNTGSGGSIVFDGVDDYVDTVSGSSTVALTSAATFSSWFKTTTSAAGELARQIGTSDNGLELIILGGKISGAAFIGTWQNFPTSSLSYNDNIWHNAVVTVSGTQITIYVDSNFIFTTSLGSGTLNTGNGKVRVGLHPNGSSSPFAGNIAITQLYNRALSASEVLQNYNATKGRFGL